MRYPPTRLRPPLKGETMRPRTFGYSTADRLSPDRGGACRRAPRRARVGLATLCVLLAACDMVAPPVPEDLREQILARRGALLDVQESWAGSGRVDLRLRSTTGLDFVARLVFPPDARPGERFPGAVLTAGFEAGRGAVDEIPPGTRVVSIAPDYPPLGRTRAGEHVSAEQVLVLSLEHVARVLLVTEYLLTRADVNPERVSLIGVSFGGFYAPAAAALEPRYRDVALMYAGADVAAIVATQVRTAAPWAAGTLGGDVIGLFLRPIEPLRWMDRIPPRHVLFVNGLFDDRVPRSSAERLHAAVRGPKDVVWLPTAHLEAGDDPLIAELVDTAFSRLPALRGAR